MSVEVERHTTNHSCLLGAAEEEKKMKGEDTEDTFAKQPFHL